ncbi:hypothetical protein COLO4_25240 [Corchorus olitorius]|uniref:Uncharacterized protein n=1 Tax=Corchorus olitorius TaxID=93759 RepID=A0A1R3I3W0_9ROSI|nr:hypothetical protein COLO4_25240 [Corchorus olitorius]
MPRRESPFLFFFGRESSVDDDESWCYGSGKVPDSLGSQVVQIPPVVEDKNGRGVCWQRIFLGNLLSLTMDIDSVLWLEMPK